MKISFISLIFFLASTNLAYGFTLNIDNGYFYGPGNAIYNDTEVQGLNKFVDAQVRNIVLTGPLTGYIPFANNGPVEPNAIAEKLQDVGGFVDGLASDGTPFNENADTALRLNMRNPDTLESEDYMVVALFSNEHNDGGEPIVPDEKGNLTFRPYILADPGYPEGVVRFNVEFTTGAAEVPMSLSGNGVDSAGPLKSGSTLIGRMGDFDLNGYLDGVLVLAANAPLEMRVGRGNPIAQVRPFTSDIPISHQEATFITLQNLLSNYPTVVMQKLVVGEFNSLYELVKNLRSGIVSARENILQAMLDAAEGGNSTLNAKNIEIALGNLRKSMIYLQSLDFDLERIGKQDPSTWDLSDMERLSNSLERQFTRVFDELGSIPMLLGGQ